MGDGAPVRGGVCSWAGIRGGRDWSYEDVLTHDWYRQVRSIEDSLGDELGTAATTSEGWGFGGLRTFGAVADPWLAIECLRI